ncbi:MAG TPA: DUF4383 domain-containing protein [Solirubrobacterales bacterium]
MEPPSPARLYAALVGAALVILGILGFFYSASFGGSETLEEAFAGIEVNAWTNLLYLATGSLGVLYAGSASRTYALTMGVFFTALAIAGWGTGWLHLTIGVLGLAAALGTPKSKPRANPVGKRA